MNDPNLAEATPMTEILCLDDSSAVTTVATVDSIGSDDRGNYALFDKTVFYPQGGGQPSDRGTISLPSENRLDIAFVRIVDDEVRHYLAGDAVAELTVGDAVKMNADAEFRVLNSRNHSAGHLLAFAAQEIKPSLTPAKGYHFSEGPYVEFSGWPEGDDLVEFEAALVANLANRVTQNRPIRSFATTPDTLAELCTFVPDFIPPGKPIRVMQVDAEGYPCGGTHVAQTGDIGTIAVRKLKYRKGVLRISYGAEDT